MNKDRNDIVIILTYIESAIHRYVKDYGELGAWKQTHLYCCISEMISELYENGAEMRGTMDLYSELNNLDAEDYFAKLDNFIEGLRK